MQGQRVRALSTGAAAVALAAAVFLLQLKAGAYHSDFDATMDEPAHVTSALMVHDYLLSGRLTHPWQFATNYYVHYPKVAILHWPPLFYGAEALWTLAAGRTRASLLLFQAVIGTAISLGLFVLLRGIAAFWLAMITALVFTTIPVVQLCSSMVSPDLLLGGLLLAAVAVYAERWDTPRGKYMVALLALAAVADHGRGVVFVLVPLLAPLVLEGPNTRRLVLSAFVLVLFATLPHVFGQALPFTLQGILFSARTYFLMLAESAGWPVLALAFAGARVAIKRRKRLPMVMMVYALACWIFHSLVIVDLAPHYLIAVIPPVLFLAGYGVSALIGSLSVKWKFPVATMAACGALTLGAWNTRAAPLKRDTSAMRIAQDDAMYQNSRTIWMVGGDPTAEGSLIAEIALRDTPLRHLVLRASKMMASSTWAGANYRLRTRDQAAVSQMLDAAHVGWIAIHTDEPSPHLDLLLQTLRAQTEQWKLFRVEDGWQIFQRLTPFPPGRARIEIDMSDKFMGTLRLDE